MLDYEFVCFTNTVRIPCRATIKQAQNLGNKKLPILTETISQFHTLFGFMRFFVALKLSNNKIQRFFCSSFKEQPHEMSIFKPVKWIANPCMYAGTFHWWLTRLLRLNFKVSSGSAWIAIGLVHPGPDPRGQKRSGKILKLEVKCWIWIEIPIQSFWRESLKGIGRSLIKQKQKHLCSGTRHNILKA
jgi:hypothetical protein